MKIKTKLILSSFVISLITAMLAIVITTAILQNIYQPNILYAPITPTILFVTALFCLIGIVAVIFFELSFTASLNELISNAKLIGSGGWNHKVKSSYAYETRQLSSIFEGLDLKIHDMRKSLDEASKKEKQASEMALKSRERFELIARNTGDWIWETDSKGKYIYSNHSVEEILGFKPDEVVEKYFYDFLLPEEKEIIKEGIFEAFTRNESFVNIPNRQIHKDGHIVITLTSGFPVLSHEGQMVGYQGSVRNITDQKQADEAHRESEDRFKSAFEDSSVGMCIMTLDYKYLQINKAFCDMVGYTKEELYAGDIKDITHPDDINENLENSKKIQKGKINSFKMEKRYIHKKGFLVWGNLNVSAVKNYKGTTICFMAQIENITTKKEMEIALKNSENRLRSIIDNSTSIIYTRDKQGRYLWVNKVFEFVHNIKQEEIVGKTGEDLIGKNIPDNFSKEDMEVFKTNMPLKVEEELLIDGSFSSFLTVKFPLTDSNGNPYAVCGISTDINEIKILRQQLSQSEKLTAIGTFIGGIAHELNNPLTSVLGYSQKLLSEKEIPKEIEEGLKVIAYESQRTAKIVQQLLRFSRSQKVGKNAVNINTLLESVVQFHSMHFSQENMEIKTSYAANMPPIMGEANQLQQVFVNIISNALYEMKKSKNGKVLKVITEHKNKNILINFENDGPQIEEEILKKIFDPFFTTKEIGKGTGLGLFVSYGIIKDHNGKIWAENTGSSGVRFTISLPVALNIKSDDKIKPDKVSTDLKLKGFHILFVEDEESLRNYIYALLKDAGASVRVASNGLEALDIIKTTDFNVIISDFRMPEMDGIKLGKWIFENRPELGKKFILVTGVIAKEIDDFCAQHKCGYLIKPFSKDDFFQVISEAL